MSEERNDGSNGAVERTYSLDLLLTMPVRLWRRVAPTDGADIGNRTRDLILTMDALYQLSYIGIHRPG